jgi:hypothetical protein
MRRLVDASRNDWLEVDVLILFRNDRQFIEVDDRHRRHRCAPSKQSENTHQVHIEITFSS